jgi:predicted nucleic acid-binding protein
MTVVVADTSPLNYLLLIGEIAILQAIYGEILIPPEVLAELSDVDAPAAVLGWIRVRPAWLQVRQRANHAGRPDFGAL